MSAEPMWQPGQARAVDSEIPPEGIVIDNSPRNAEPMGAGWLFPLPTVVAMVALALALGLILGAWLG